MRRAEALLLAAAVPVVVASACGGKVVLDTVSPSSSSSTGMGGAASSSSSSMGGFVQSTSFDVSSVQSSSNDATVSSGMSTGDVLPGCGSFQISQDPMCQACAAGACCSELQVCDTGTACADMFGCLSMCQPGDTACGTSCEISGESGLPDAQKLASCFQTACGQNGGCAMSTQICDSAASSGNVICDVCLGSACCAPIDACIADATCLACLENMGPQCAQNMLLSSLMTCAQQCGAQCGG